MGILDKVLGNKHDDDSSQATPPTPEVEAADCPHTAMTPHWDSLDDMGKQELATYTCEACGRTFSHAQAKQFLDQPPPAVLAAGRAPETYDDGTQ